MPVETAGEQITLRPLRRARPLTKEYGVWVFHTRQILTASATDEVLQQIREERDAVNLGEGS